MKKSSELYFIGFDIGGTKCAAILGRVENEKIEILGKKRFATETEKGYMQTLSHLEDSFSVLLREAELENTDVSGIGISCGGPLDSKKGVILSPPNLIGWDGVEIVSYFERRLGVKTALQNDANACAVAEWKFGAGRGAENMVFLTFGTGFGAGLILGGRLYSGSNDMAGEVGHIRLAPLGPVGYGKSGSAEGFCSGGGIAQIAKTRVTEVLQAGGKVPFCSGLDELETLSAKTVADAADAGHPLARRIYEESGEYLGRCLAVLIDLLNPELIVIGSIYARSENLLREPALRMIEAEARPLSRGACRVVPAALGEAIGDIAAISVAML